ncbi:MAG: asparaginase [Steroidobacteraceae bacterium]
MHSIAISRLHCHVVSLAAASLLCLNLAAQAAQPALPKVRIISVGGTIDSTAAERTNLANYGGDSPRIPVEKMVQQLPELKTVANVTVEEDMLPTGGPGRTMATVLKVAKRVNEIFAKEPDIAGIVITQGTNNLEESAYFLNLTVHSNKPVVFVGAQRPSTALSSDGWLNLYNGIRIAASPESIGRGVLLAMNDEINAARDVKKSAAYRVQAFQSPDLGVLGYADPDKVIYYRLPTRRHTINSEFDAGRIDQLPQVDVQASYLEASGAPIDALVAEGAKGIVVDGSGAGSPSNQQNDAIKRAQAKGVIVVVTTRTGTGRVIETNSRTKSGVIPGDNLTPQKARILLQIALTKTSDPKEIKRIFDEY